MELLVLLSETPVGLIRSAADGRIQFSFLQDYLRLPRRPVLGQFFEDHLNEVQRSRVHLPPFFSNLLPEGGLRELIARRAGVNQEKETDLLGLLGEDLPGAVVVRRLHDQTEDMPDDSTELGSDEAEGDGPLRFSLAGAQLKFSVLYREAGRGPTLPLDGRGGNWIAKLPSETYEGVPENEHAMITWAGRVGIAVPETALVRAREIEGLPVQIDGDRSVFLSRRFDRPSIGERIHQEDFAQVANVRHSKRYGSLSHTSIARIVRQVAGEQDLDEVVRRTTFNILIGNGDAHLKNWSLWYPNGIEARLSPAYDLVATVTYIHNDRLVLRLSRESRFAAIGLAHFERLGDKVGATRSRVTSIVRETIQKAMSTWPEELQSSRSKLLREHVGRLQLVAEAG